MLPNFIVIGAAKSGTTSLYYYLKQHPQIYMSPVKETDFFIYKGMSEKPNKRMQDIIKKRRASIYQKITHIEDYESLFKDAVNEKAIGEGSVHYLFGKGAHTNIKDMLPDVKLIAILRNPVDRAFSHFRFKIGGRRETNSDFLKIIKQQISNMNMISSGKYNMAYIEGGMYFQHLKKYYDLFNKEQIHICLYDDLINNPQKLMYEIYDFLDVNTAFEPNMEKRHKVTKAPNRGSKIYHLIFKKNFFKWLFKKIFPKNVVILIRNRLYQKTTHKWTMTQKERQILREFYKDDINNLQTLIKRDLSQWLQ